MDGLLIILAGAATSFGKDLAVLRTDMELGMICAGIMVIIVGLTGLMEKILKIFNPIVNGNLSYINGIADECYRYQRRYWYFFRLY